MNDEIEYCDGTPDISMMPKSGMVGYSLSQSISELVDNSIDERLDGILLKIRIEVKNGCIVITDNAGGMNKSEIINAMILARETKGYGKLGIHGMGMKAACVSIGRYFDVTSVKNGSKQAWITWWEEEEWYQRGAWENPRKRTSFPQELKDIRTECGTVIRIKNLRYKTESKVNQLRGELGRRFAPFISRGMIGIEVNEKICKSIIPEIINNSKREICIKTKHGPISGWIAIMKDSSQGGLYGFDTYRFERMITYYDKFAFKPHPTVARIMGELHMNHVPVTTNKREWEKTSPLYEEAEQMVGETIKDVVAKIKRMTKGKKIGNVEKNNLEQFKEGLSVAIECEELKEYILPEKSISENNKIGLPPPEKPDLGQSDKPDVPTAPYQIKTVIADVEVEKRIKPDESSKGTRIPTGTGPKRHPKRTHIVKRPTKTRLIIKGRQFDYNHELRKLGEKGPIYETDYDKKTRKLDIFTNADFPAAKITNDRAYYIFTQIVEAVTMVIIEEANADWNKYDEIRQTLLREAAKHVAILRDKNV